MQAVDNVEDKFGKKKKNLLDGKPNKAIFLQYIIRLSDVIVQAILP